MILGLNLRQNYARLPGQGLHRLGKFHPLMPHQKPEGIPRFPAAKAMINLTLRRNHKRGRFLMVKRTTGLKIPSRALKRQAAGDYLNYINTV